MGELEELALLRVDGNFYESYHSALYHLWDAVPVGGAILFDDFSASRAGATGPRLAWEDFKRAHGLSETLQAVDWTSSLIVKETDVRVRWETHAPRRQTGLKTVFG